MDITAADLITIALLVALEALLSADNALVLAVLVLGLPKAEQRKALRYGIVGAFVFRIVAILLAAYLIRLRIVMLIGAGYLFWLAFHHFFGHADAEARRMAKKATPWLGLSAFWTTVVKVELTDIVFAIDSILVAVAMSNKLWVIISGGILGVVAMRLVIGQMLSIVTRYPAIVDGAFVIIGWVGLKLVLEFLHGSGYIHFQVPKTLSLGLIVVIFVLSFLYARRKGPAVSHSETQDDAAALLVKEPRDSETV